MPEPEYQREFAGWMEIRREVVIERHVAVGALAQVMLVDPDFAVLVDAVKLHANQTVSGRFW